VVDLSPAKILVVLVVALLVLGPEKLPRAARQAGRLVNDFRRFKASIDVEVREALGDPGALSSLPARGRAWVTSVVAEARPQVPPEASPHQGPAPPFPGRPEGSSPGAGAASAGSADPAGAGAAPSPPGPVRGGFDPRFN
jgi:sec-independent protein translocase protein TatB